MRSEFLVIFLMFFVVSCTAALPCRVINDNDKIVEGKLAAELDAALTQSHINGDFDGVVMMKRGQETLLKRAYGCANRSTNKLNSLSVISDIGSIAKSFTAVAIMQLHAQNKLSIDDTIDHYFPSVPADKKIITIRQLLTHTSGLPNYHSRGDFDAMTRTQGEQKVLSLSLRYPPGEDSGYSNAGYMLLGAIVERVSRTDFQSHVSNNILKPLGLNSTAWYGSNKIDFDDIALGYVGNRTGETTYDNPVTWALLAGGGMVSNIDDLTVWYDALLNKQLFSEELNKTILAPNDYDRTLAGLRKRLVENQPALEIGGSTDFGYTAKIQYFQDADIMVVLLFNGYSPRYGPSTHHVISNRVMANVIRQYEYNP
jgi:CubicO group peptidase (beta-lactamase class C family)